MNFSINNLNGTNASISSMISQLVAKKSSTLSSLMDQSNSLQSSISALKNYSYNTGGSLNSSYSSQISSLQDAIDRLNSQYTINENKLSTINSLNNSYKKTVSTLDDYINSLKNPTNVSETINASSSNTNVADVTMNGTANVQTHNMTVTQLATCSTLTSSKIKGSTVTGSTKITDLFSGSYNASTNTITSIRTDLRGDLKLSDVGITSGAFKIGSHVIRVDEDETLNDLMTKINASGEYNASIDTTTGAFTIQGLNGNRVDITNAVGDLSVSGNIALDTKLADIGVKTGTYFVGNAQVDVAQGDTVATLIDKIEATGYRAELITDPSNPSGKVLNITDAGGNAVETTATNFTSLAGFTVSSGTFTVNGTEFNIDTNTTIDDLVYAINAATTDKVGAEFKNGKIILTASETGAVDITVEKGSSNFTNAIGFTQGGVMYTGNYVVGSEGSCATLTGVNNSVQSDAVAGGVVGTNTVRVECMTLEEAEAQGYTIINSAEEFISKINASPTGKFYLNADIVIDESVHGNISSFCGTLEGNGHSITYTGTSPLFESASSYAIFNNITLEDCVVDGGSLFLGAAVGDVSFNNVNIIDSVVNNSDSANFHTSGLVGIVHGGSTLDFYNIDISGLTMNVGYESGPVPYVGALIAFTGSCNINVSNLEIIDLDINMDTNGQGFVGALAGSAYGNLTLDNVYIQGDIGGNVGSITSALNANYAHDNCTVISNDVFLDVSGARYVCFGEDSYNFITTRSYDGVSTTCDASSFATSVQSTISEFGVLNETASLSQVTAGTIVINGTTISLSGGNISDAIDEINAQSATTGIEADIVDDKVQFKPVAEGGTVSIGDCTSNFATVAGIEPNKTYETFSTGSFTLSYSEIDAAGLCTGNMLATTIQVNEGDTVDDIIEKIKTQTTQTYTDEEGVEQTNYWQGQIVGGKFQLTQSEKGADYKINVIAGGSNFTTYVGLTTEVVQGNAIAGTSTTYTGATAVDAGTVFTQGSFSITASKENNPSETETVTFTVDDGETLDSVMEKINSSCLAITASIVEHSDGTQRLQLTHKNQGSGYTITTTSGTSNFTEVVGFSNTVSIGVVGAGDTSSLTGVTSGLTLSDTGYTDGSFAIKATKLSADGTVAGSETVTVEIGVSSEMSLEDVLAEINSATYIDDEGNEVDLGLRASLTADGKILIEQIYTGEGFDIEVIGGTTNFTSEVGLTSTTTTAISTMGKNSQIVGENSFTVTNKSEDGTTFDDDYSFSEGSFVITTSETTITELGSVDSSKFVMGTNTTYSTLHGTRTDVVTNPNRYSSITSSVEYMSLEEAQAQGYTIINTGEEFVDLINSNSDGKFYLNADITIDMSVQGRITEFSGVLEGNGHTIEYTGDVALIKYVSGNAQIKNLDITADIRYELQVYSNNAILIQETSSNSTLLLDNVNILNSTVNFSNMGSACNFGSLIGYVDDSTVTARNIDISNLTINDNNVYNGNVGGLFGYIYGDNSLVTLNNAEIYGLTINSTQTGYVGGILGTSNGTENVVLNDVYVQASINASGSTSESALGGQGNLFSCTDVFVDVEGVDIVSQSMTASEHPSINVTKTYSGFTVNTGFVDSAKQEIVGLGLVDETRTLQVSAGTIKINGVEIELTGGTIEDAVAQINAQRSLTKVTASFVDGGVCLKSTFTSSTPISIEAGTSDFFEVTGLSSGERYVGAFAKGTFTVTYSEVDADGNLTGNLLTTTINVDGSDSVADVAEKIKTQTTQAWTDSEGNAQSSYWQGSVVDGQFVLTSNQTGKGYKISVSDDTSGFALYTGLEKTVYDVEVDANNDIRTVINIEEGDSLQDVVNKINNADIGVTAYIDDNGKLTIESQYSDPNFKIEVESGTSDFLAQAGLATELTSVAEVVYGTEEVQYSTLTGTNVLKAEYMTLQEAQAQGYTIINTAEEFVTKINANAAGKFYLNADIAIDKSVHGSISQFGGVLEGNGHTITYTGNSPLINNVSYAVPLAEGVSYGGTVSIRNITLENCNVDGSAILIGSVQGANFAFTNVNVVNSTLTTDSNHSGALICTVEQSSIIAKNIDVSGLHIVSTAQYTNHVGGLFGYLDDTSTLSLNNAEIVDLDIDANTSGYVGGIIGYSANYYNDVHSLSNVYLQGSIKNSYSGVDTAYELGGFIGSNTFTTNNVFIDTDETHEVTMSFEASLTPVLNNESDLDISSIVALSIQNFGTLNEDIPYTQITEGTFEINGVNINLSAGSIFDAIDQINAHTAETGVVASIVDNKVQLKSTTTGNQVIYVDGGTSDFGVVTGLTTKSVGGGVSLGTEATLHSISGSKTVVSEYMSLEQAKNLGYTIINSEEEFISAIKASPSGKFYLNCDLDIDASNHGRINAFFTGVLEGNGHSITYHSDQGGLFMNLTGATVSNLTLTGSVVGNDSSTGFLADIADGSTFNNVDFRDAALNAQGGNGGFIAGSATDISVKNSDIEGGILENGYRLGVLFGLGNGVLDIQNTQIDGLVFTNFDLAGGVVGCANSGSTINLTDVYIGDNILFNGSGGAIAGEGAGSTINVKNVFIDYSTADNVTTADGSCTIAVDSGFYFDESIGHIPEIDEYAVNSQTFTQQFSRYCSNDGVFSDGLTQISAGTIKINGSTINLNKGTINDAIAKINERTSVTGVSAEVVNGKVKFSSLSSFTIEEGTSDFVEKTGVAGYSTTNATAVDVLQNFSQTYSTSRVDTVEHATALGYTAVTTANELMAALSAGQGKIILMNDIDFNGFTGYTGTVTFEGTLDGNGYTIRNYGLNTAMIDNLSGATSIKNLRFENANITAAYNNNHYALIVGYDNDHSLSFENIEIVDSSINIRGYLGHTAFLVAFASGCTTFKNITLKNADIISTGSNFVSGDTASDFTPRIGLLGGSMTNNIVDGVTIDSDSSISVGSMGNVGGLFANASGNTTIRNTYVDAQINITHTSTADQSSWSNFGGLIGSLYGSAGVSNTFVGTFINENTIVANKSSYFGKVNTGATYNISKSYHDYIASGITETITGSTRVTSAPTSITGGSFIEGAFKSQLTEEQAIARGYTVIKTAQEFVDKITANTSGKFMLMNSIDLTGITGTDTLTFMGELHGNGYTLSNYTSENAGLFGLVEDGSIKDITIDNFNTIGGTLAYTQNNWSTSATFENITVKNSTVACDYDAGALFGFVAGDFYSIFDNIKVTNTTVEGKCAGGLVGCNCSSNFIVTNSYIDADITGSESAGGVVGQSDCENSVFSNIYTTGSITLTDASLDTYGGLFGDIFNGPSISVTNSIINSTSYKSSSAVAGCAIYGGSNLATVTQNNNLFGSSWTSLYYGTSATTSPDIIINDAPKYRDLGSNVYKTLSAGTLTIKGAYFSQRVIDIKDGWTINDLANAINITPTGVFLSYDGFSYSVNNARVFNISGSAATLNKDADTWAMQQQVQIKSSLSGLDEDTKISDLTTGDFNFTYKDNNGDVHTAKVQINSGDTVGTIIDKINALADSSNIIKAGLASDGKLYIDGAVSIENGTTNLDSLLFKADTIKSTATSGSQAALLGSVNITGSETLVSGAVVISAGNKSQKFTYANGDTVEDVMDKINSSSLGVSTSIYNGKLLLVNNNMQDSDNLSVEEVSGNFGAVTGTTTISPQQGVAVVGHAGSCTTLTGSKAVDSIMTVEEARASGYTIVTNQDELATAIDNNATIFLACDIEITDASVLGKSFSGTLWGNGNTITSKVASDVGLFGVLSNASIDGLNLSGFNITASGNTSVGVLARRSSANVSVSDVAVYNSTITGSRGGTNYAPSAGALIGNSLSGTNLTVNNVKIDDTVEFKGTFQVVGGIFGTGTFSSLSIQNADIAFKISSGIIASSVGAVIGVATNYSSAIYGDIKNINVSVTNESDETCYAVCATLNSTGILDVSNIWIDDRNSCSSELAKSASMSKMQVEDSTINIASGINQGGVTYTDFEYDMAQEHYYSQKYTQVTAGTININGVSVNLSGGTLAEALYEINSYSQQTGVTADIKSFGDGTSKVVFQNTQQNANGISITEGTSNFVEITGVAGYSVAAPVETEIGGYIKGENVVQSTHYTKEEAEAMGYIWITDAEELKSISESAGASVKVMLGCDIDLSSISATISLDGVSVFDGNGYSLMNYTGTSGLFAKFVLSSSDDLTVKNLKIDNFNVNSTSAVPVGALFNFTTTSITFENVEVSDTVVTANQSSNVGLLVGSVLGLQGGNYAANVVFDNVKVDGSGITSTSGVSGALAGTVVTNGIVLANNVLIDDLALEIYDGGSMFGSVSGTLAISASEVVNSNILASGANVAGVVGRYDNTKNASYVYSGDPRFTMNDVRASIDFSDDCASSYAQIVSSSTVATINRVYYDSSKITGATEKGTATTDVVTDWQTFDENWSAKGIAKTARQAQQEGYICIYTAQELVDQINDTANDGKRRKYMLMNDIDMSGIDLGTGITDFCGVLDGNGYSIKNYTSDNGGALFQSAYGSAEIKNLTLDGFNIDKSSGSGLNNSAALICTVSNDSVKIENVTVKNSNISGETVAAGLVASVSISSLNLNNVYVDETVNVESTGIYAGGIVGYSSSGFVRITNSQSFASVINSSGTADYSAGQAVGSCGGTLLMDNVNLGGSVSATGYAGVVSGKFSGTGAKIISNSCLGTTVAAATNSGMYYGNEYGNTFFSINNTFKNSISLTNMGDDWFCVIESGCLYATDSDYETTVSQKTFNEDYYTMVTDSSIAVKYYDYQYTNQEMTLTVNISAGTIQSAVDQINKRLTGLPITATINSENKVVIETTDPRTRNLQVINKTGNFFEVALSDSAPAVHSGWFSSTGTITRLTESTKLGSLAGDQFFEGYITDNTLYNANTTVGDVISVLNNEFDGRLRAYLDDQGRLVINKDGQYSYGSFNDDSQLLSLLGHFSATVADTSVTDIGEEAVTSTLTGSKDITASTVVSAGDFRISYAGDITTYNVTAGMTMQDVVDMINHNDPNLSADIRDNKIYLYDVNDLYSKITISDGTSDFAELAGFTIGNDQAVSLAMGNNAMVVSQNTAASSEGKYCAGTFSVSLTDMNGNVTASETYTITESDTIATILEQINNGSLGVTASIDENTGKVTIQRADSEDAGLVTVSKGTSDFTNVLGFTQGGVQSVEFEQSATAKITSAQKVTGKTYSEGHFVIDLLDVDGNVVASHKIDVLAGDTTQNIVDRINSMKIGVTASIDATTNKLVMVRNNNAGEGTIQIRKGTSDFTNVLGLTSGGSCTASFDDGDITAISAKYAASNTQRFTEGDFVIKLTGDNESRIQVNVSSTDSVYNVANKINDMDAGVHAYVDNNAKLVIVRDSDSGIGGLEIVSGTSSITDDLGFTGGGEELASLSKAGSVSKIVSTLNHTTVGNSYTAGNFYIQLLDAQGNALKNGLITVNIAETNGTVDDIYTVIQSINSQNAGVTASLDNQGRLVIQKDEDAEAGSLMVLKGSSDFTEKFGFTSGGQAVGDTFVSGANAAKSVLTSNDLGSKLASDSATLGSIGVTDGTMKVNGVNIAVKSTDTVADLAARISTECADMGIKARYVDGQLIISSSDPTKPICVEKGTSNFAVLSNLAGDYKNSLDMGVVDVGNNALFTIDGQEYEMALTLNANGENVLYLDADGNVITDAANAALTVNIKQTGNTVIEVGRQLLNDSVEKLQTFVNRFNSAMKASANMILADDMAFKALLNRIDNALTSRVGSYTNIANELANIGISLGLNSDGTLQMTLTKTAGEYDYVNAFYQNPDKVMDLLVGEDAEPLDFSAAGVFTRLSSVLHEALEDTRTGYFKVTPRSLESQQKALKNEITSLTFDLNELKSAVGGSGAGTGAGGGVGGDDAYLALLEAQYQMLNQAIADLNKQYNSSLVRLILNQNNSSFNPIV